MFVRLRGGPVDGDVQLGEPAGDAAFRARRVEQRQVGVGADADAPAGGVGDHVEEARVHPAVQAHRVGKRDVLEVGLVVPLHGFVAAGELVRALAGAARLRGAQVIEGRQVLRIVFAKGQVTVETNHGPLSGSAVVLAAGSWSGHIEIVGLPARAPVRPIRGQLLRLAWKGPMIRRVVWSERCYLVPWDDGTLLVGATVEDAGFDERTTAAGVRDLLEAACEIVPGAWTAGFIDARAGLRPASADLLPIIGASRVFPNLMYATAHYRNGVLLAPVTAAIVADALLDNRIDSALAALSPQRFGDL